VRARRARHPRAGDQRARRLPRKRAGGDVLERHRVLLAAWQRGVSRSPGHRRCARRSRRRRKAVAHPSSTAAASRGPHRPRRGADGAARRGSDDAAGGRALSSQLHAAPREHAIAVLAARVVRSLRQPAERGTGDEALARALRPRFEPAVRAAARGSRQAIRARPERAFRVAFEAGSIHRESGLRELPEADRREPRDIEKADPTRV